MRIIFFKSHTFLTREIENALRERTDISFVNVSMPQYPHPSEIPVLIERLRPFFPALIIVINDAGLDFQGLFQEQLIKMGCHIVNWYHDYPFYEEIFQQRKMVPSKERIDFVSENSFVDEMTKRGFNCNFLPLATDPNFFYTLDKIDYRTDISFVGNSSSLFIDSVLTEYRTNEIEKLLPLLGILKKQYYKNPQSNLREYLLENSPLWERKTYLGKEETLFILEWLCGYFYRRDFIKLLSDKYPGRFICYGDADWKHFIDPSIVSTEACYYSNLHETYQTTKINLNVNRIQIRTSFTQRIFDCAACGAFLLTDKRTLNDLFFKTDGPEIELVQFSSFDECCGLIDYFLSHDQERKAIAARAQKKVLSEHTYAHRLAAILSKCKSQWGV